MTQLLQMHYLLLPMGGKHVLWVEAPSREWILVAGKWNNKAAAVQFAMRAGYHEAKDKARALNEIETQLEARLVRAGKGPQKYRKEGCPSPLHCTKTPRCQDGCERVGVGLKKQS